MGNSRHIDYFKDREHIKYDPEKKELREILKSKEELTDHNSVIRAKTLAESIQAKLKTGRDEGNYRAAKAKLSLLEHLY